MNRFYFIFLFLGLLFLFLSPILSICPAVLSFLLLVFYLFRNQPFYFHSTEGTGFNLTTVFLFPAYFGYLTVLFLFFTVILPELIRLFILLNGQDILLLPGYFSIVYLFSVFCFIFIIKKFTASALKESPIH